MKHFFSVDDIEDPIGLANSGIKMKEGGFSNDRLSGKTICLLFFNSSLRTRLSMQKAAIDLGVNVMVLNVSSDSWQIELEEGVVMNAGTAEHIKEAARVISQYCDVVGIRVFAQLIDKEKDYSDKLIKSFIRYSEVPVINMESCTLHPLQSLADLMTILEFQKASNPKVVLTWAPHVRALPQAVANSFSTWILKAGLNLTIACPDGFELDSQFTGDAKLTNNQMEAIDNADFVYVKNWSSYRDYGNISDDSSWMLDNEKLKVANDPYIMHCLPVRRNLVLPDEILDGPNSLVIDQARNRLHAAKIALNLVLS